MNTHDIELPAEFRSGNDIPVTQATIKRERMEEILVNAIEADRQGRMPSDEEIDKLSHGFALQYQDHVRGFARALLSRYSSGKPAASAEPDVERGNWLASLCPEDRMFEEIDQLARKTYQRHINSKRGQMVMRADSWDAHVVWATKRWLESHVPSAAHVAQEPVTDAATTLAAICDLFGIGSAARDPSTILANVENAVRRSRCLSAIERVLVVETPPDPDEGDDEPGEECLLRWGADPEGYAEHFQAALKKFGYTLAPVAAQARPTMPALTDAMRAVLRNEREVYEREDALYAALCDAAGAQPVVNQSLTTEQDREDAGDPIQGADHG